MQQSLCSYLSGFRNSFWLNVLLMSTFLFFSIKAHSQVLSFCSPQTLNQQLGEDFELDIKVKDFENITRFQFSMSWDKDFIDLQSIDNFTNQLPNFNNNSIGNNADNGILTVFWFDNTFQSVTLADSTILFTLHFTAEQCGVGDLAFTDNPYVMEAYGENNQVLVWTGENATITVDNFLPLTVEASQDTIDFGALPVGRTNKHSIVLVNHGCDTFNLHSSSFSHPAFELLTTSIVIPPDSSLLIDFSFRPDAVQTYLDSVMILANTMDIKLYLKGEGIARPVFNYGLDTIRLVVENCDGQTMENLSLKNDGLADLEWSASIVNTAVEDDFESGINDDAWSALSGGTVTSNACGTNSTVYFFDRGVVREATTKFINTQNGGTINFSIMISRGGFGCNGPDHNEDVYLDYSIDNGHTWHSIQFLGRTNYPTLTPLSLPIPEEAQSPNTLFRWKQHSFGVDVDHWLLDDISIIGENSSLSLSLENGTITAENSQIIPLNFDAIGLYSGKYYFDVVLETNDTFCPLPETETANRFLMPSNDCISAAFICAADEFALNPSNTGVINEFSNNNNSDGCLAAEHHTSWFFFAFDGRMPANSNFSFLINPSALSDYDFAIWEANVDCEHLGNPIRCSFSKNAGAIVGLENGAGDNSENAAGDGRVEDLIVNPNEQYYVLVDNWSADNKGFNFIFGGNALPYLGCPSLPIFEDCSYNGLVHIPVVVEVQGAPLIRLSSPSIDFGTSQRGVPVCDTLTIYNTGCDSLRISEFSFSHPTFYTDSILPSIAPNEVFELKLFFEPDALSTYNETLEIISNGELISCQLLGEGLPTSKIELHPDTLLVQINTCGDSVTYQATIDNSNGTEDLIYCIDNTSASSTTEILVSTYGIDTGSEYANTLAAIAQYTTDYNISEINTIDTTEFQMALKGKNVLILPDQRYISFDDIDTLNNTLGAFAKRGGTIIFCGTGNSLSVLRKGLFTGSYGSTYNFGTICIPWNAYDHPLLENIPVSFSGPYYIHTYSFTNPDAINLLHNGQSVFELLPVDYGNVVYIGFDYSDFNAETAQIMTNAIKFNPKPFVVNIPVLTGMIPAGTSEVVDVTVYAGDLLNGTYTNRLLIETNDPTQLLDTLTILLEVNGIAETITSTDIVDFGTYLANGTTTENFTIYNTGCDTLRVDDMNFSSIVFSTSMNEFDIAPNDSLSIPLQFSPDAISTYNETLDILTNVGTTTITLLGEGLPSAQIAVYPDTIFASINDCNDTVTHQITIDNTSGDADLIYQIDTSFVEVLALTYGVDYNEEYAHTLEAIAKYTTAYHLSEINTTNPDILEAALEQKNVLLIGDQEYGYDVFFTNFQPVLQKFVEKGGTVVFCGTANHKTVFNTGLFTGRYFNNLANLQFHVFDTQSSLLTGVEYPIIGQYNTHTVKITNPDLVQVVGRFDVDLEAVSYRKIGKGFAIYVAFNYFEYDDNAAKIIGNAIQFNNHFLYKDVENLSGTVPVGTSTNVDVTLYADDLSNGIYHNNIYIKSNDPARPVDTVAIVFKINGLAELMTSTTNLDFVGSQVNEFGLDSMIVYNTGCDTLKVSALNFSSTIFSTTTTSINISPYDSLVLPIYFTPDAISFYNETLDIVTNVGTTTIDLLGEGLPSPQIDIQPDTLFAYADNCGELLSYQVTIDNSNGEADLIYQIDSVLVSNKTEILALSYGEYYGQEYENTLETIAQYATDYYITATNTTDADELAEALKGKHIVLISDQGGISPNIFSDIQAPLLAFVEQGGTVIFCGTKNDDAINNSGLFSGTYQRAVNNRSFSVDESIHPLLEHIAPSIASTYYTYTYDFSNPNMISIIEYFEEQVIALNPIGEGFALYIGFNFILYNDKMAQIMANAVKVFGYKFAAIEINPFSDTIPAGSSDVININFDIDGLTNGVYHKNILLETNDANQSIDTLVIHLTVNLPGNFETSDTLVDFGTNEINTTATDSITIYNTGCAPLEVTDIVLANTVFSTNASPFELAPNDSIKFLVSFSPEDMTVYEDTLRLIGSLPEHKIVLRGNGIGKPIFSMSPDTILISTTDCNYMETFPLIISNIGEGDLNIEFTFTDNFSLDKTLEKLNQQYSELTDLIPNRYDFTEGETGIHINDGGLDMYDGGNYLSINNGSYLEYTNGMIQNSDLLGTGGRYFTAKYPGLFVLAVDINDINHFDINGSLGTSGPGHIDGAVLTVDHYGISYTGFVKRASSPSNPSVNHLMITKTGTATHYFPYNTLSDYHEINNLNDHEELYYLLFSEETGSYVDDIGMENIMKKFLNIVFQSRFTEEPWAQILPITATIPASESTTINIQIDASQLVNGIYEKNIIVATNDVDSLSVPLYIQLALEGEPEIEVSTNAIDFGEILVGDTVNDTIRIYNRGCDTLKISDLLLSHADFIYEIMDTIILPNDSITAIIYFTPSNSGDYDELLTIHNNAQNQNINLVGTGLAAPEIELGTNTINQTIIDCEGVITIPMSIQNTGMGNLEWTLAEPFDFISPSVGIIEPMSEQMVMINIEVATYSAGEYDFTLSIESNDVDEPILNIPVHLTFPNRADWSVASMIYAFGEQVLNTPRTEYLILNNTGCDPIQITDLVFSHPNFFSPASTYILPSYGQLYLPITFQPREQRNYFNFVTIVTDQGNRDVGLTGEGIDYARCDDEVLNFGNANIPSDFYRVSDAIYAGGQVRAGENVHFRAANSIEFQADFEVELGADFYAAIESCETEPADRSEAAVEEFEMFSGLNLKIFPNPLYQEATIRYKLDEEATVQIRLFDATGQLKISLLKETTQTAGLFDLKLNARQLPAGFYYVALRAGEKYAVQKIIISDNGLLKK